MHVVSPSLGGGTVLVDTGVGPAGLWGWDAEFEEGLLPALEEARARRPRMWTSCSSRTSTSTTSAGTPTGTASSSFRTRATSRIATGSRFAGNSGRPHIERTILSVEFEEIDGEAVVAEGVTAFPLPGHFPGHMGLRIDSEGERAVLIADAAVNPMLLDRARSCLRLGRRCDGLRGNAPRVAAGARRPGRPRRLRPLSSRRDRPCRDARRPRRVGGGTVREELVFLKHKLVSARFRPA